MSLAWRPSEKQGQGPRPPKFSIISGKICKPVSSYSSSDILGALLRIILKAHNQIIEGLVCQGVTAKGLGKWESFLNLVVAWVMGRRLTPYDRTSVPPLSQAWAAPTVLLASPTMAATEAAISTSPNVTHPESWKNEGCFQDQSVKMQSRKNS